jgi:hypothetical protein
VPGVAGLLRGREEHGVPWNIELLDDCAVVVMNTNKVNAQNDRFLPTFTMRSTGWSAISIHTQSS